MGEKQFFLSIKKSFPVTEVFFMNISDSKKHRRFLVSLLSFFLLSSSLLPGLPGRALGAPTQPAPSSTPVALHGKLKVEKSRLTDCHGNPFQLYGMSTHGIAWFPQYISRDTFLTGTTGTPTASVLPYIQTSITAIAAEEIRRH